MKIITIIGSGMMGSAMARPAMDNGYQVRLVGTPLDREIIDSVKKNGYHPTLHTDMTDGVTAYQFEEVDEALKDATMVICGVSSFGVDWFTKEALPHIQSGLIVLSITKGLALGENGVLTPFPLLWKSVRPDLRFVAVGGPCICFELMKRRHTLVNFASPELAAAQEAAKILGTDYYHLLPTDDVYGVETGVGLKNAYAMGVSLGVGLAEREIGITDARGMEGQAAVGAFDNNPIYNPQAALFAQSCIEMRRIIRLLGGNGDFGGGVPGAGDLYVTVFGGRTRRLGTLLGRGLPYTKVREVLKGVTLEAVAIITRVAESLRIRASRGEVDLDNFPLMMHMDAILNQGAPVAIPWQKFGE